MADNRLNEMYGNGNSNAAAERARQAELNRQAAKRREDEQARKIVEEQRALENQKRRMEEQERYELDAMTKRAPQRDQRKSNNSSRRYTSHSGYKTMRNVYQDRNEGGRAELARRPKKRKVRKDRVAIVGAVGAVGLLAAFVLPHSFGGKDTTDPNPQPTINDPSVQVIKEVEIDYEWTNMYSRPPEYNKKETLHYGDIVRYDPTGIGYYNDDDGIIAKVSSVEAQNPHTKWVTCYDEENDMNGFVPDEYVAKYTAYTLNSQYEKAFYRTNYSLSNPDEKITTGTIVYVKDDSPMINQDSIMLYPMIIINQEKNHSAVEVGENDVESDSPQYITGYIELGKLEKAKGVENIGCISAQKTFLRSSPSVTELDDSIIIGQIENGEKISVVEEVQEGQEKWYKCVSGDTAFYVAEYATRPIKEKEEPVEQPMTSEIDSTNESKDKLTYLMDMSLYTTFDSFKFHVDDLIAHDCMGGVILEIGKTVQKAEFSQKCMKENNTKESEGNGVSSNKKLQDYYNEINTHFAAGQNEKNMDFGNLEDIEKYIEYLVEKDVPVGFYYYSCAINPNEASAEAAYIYALEKKFYQDIPELKNAKVLPISIDIEDANMSRKAYFDLFPNKTEDDYLQYHKLGDRNGKKEERTEAVAQIIQLLGNGTNTPGCWCIDGCDSKNGYGLLKDNQVTIYSGTNQTAATNEYKVQSLYINSLEDLDARVPDEYNIIQWQTRHAYLDSDYVAAGKKAIYDDDGNFIRYEAFNYNDDRMQSDFLDYGIVDTINNNSYYRVNPKEGGATYACKNAIVGDIMQVALNLNFDANDGSQCIDLSATNQYTIDAILDGTYTHTETFVDKINRVYELQIENSEIDDMYLQDGDIEH